MPSTVTVTTQYTITVTQAASVFTTAGAASPLQKGSTANGSEGPGNPAQNESGNDSNSPGSPAQNGSGDNTQGSNSTLENGTSVNGSTGGPAQNGSGTAAASASTGMGNLYGNGTLSGSKYPVVTNASSPSGSNTSSNSTGSLTGLNTTVAMHYTSEDADLYGEFWAGGMYVS